MITEHRLVRGKSIKRHLPLVRAVRMTVIAILLEDRLNGGAELVSSLRRAQDRRGAKQDHRRNATLPCQNLNCLSHG
jgi:hypothetical protein